ncbi:uncharacterized protein OCT59_028276 [Rhizophagus irregularis]|uniref:uncharacterized protein n=1 Tax=Rhizophagus irregularis TaxID=588596 RepID=UPI0033323C0B|nr:hypothetical protein OCT59_028276 [Rhizophagus irregularis]
MATRKTIPKTRKLKTNNFVTILEQHLDKYNLSANSTLEQLREHAPELNAQLHDWTDRKSIKNLLVRGTKKRKAFSKEQIGVLVPDKRKEKLTIEERAKYCAKAGTALDIFAHHLELGPKNKDENEIVAGASRQSTFRVKLAEGGVDTATIDTFAKDPKLIQESNKIQKERTDETMANSDGIPPHFSLARVCERLQNIDTSKIPNRENLADVIVMLSMRPSEVSSLQIMHYEPESEDPPAWYKRGYTWYCIGYKKDKGKKDPRRFLSMEKDPERARELLIWIQEAIKAGKLRDPPYKSLPKDLRKIGGKHACRTHGGPKSTPQHLSNLTKIALRHYIGLDAGNNYSKGDTETEDSESDHNPEPESESAENDEISDIINMYSY